MGPEGNIGDQGIKKKKDKSEAQVNEGLDQSVKKEAAEKGIPGMEDDIRSKFFDATKFNDMVGKFYQENSVFAQNRDEIIKKIWNQIGNKKPEGDESFWDQGLLETVEKIIQDEINEKS